MQFRRLSWLRIVTNSRILGGLLCVGVVSAMAFAAEDKPAPPAAPPVSKFAAVEPLVQQVDYHVERIGQSLDASNYSEAIQSRVQKDANILVILLMALGMHDQDSAYKASAPRLVELAEELVTSATDQAKAKAAYASLAKGIQDGEEGGKPLAWEHRAQLGLLMKQVTTINSRLRMATLRESRFARAKEDAAGYAAALAVVGQAAHADTHEVKDPAMVDEWYKYASEMRDAAGAVGEAIAKDDFAAVQASMQRLQANCDACHEAFRIDTTAAAAEE